MSFNKFTLSIPLILATFVLTSCGVDGKKSLAGRWASELQMKTVMENAEVTCGNAGLDCPAQVALAVMASENGSDGGQCTSFAIGPNRMMTNSHCIEHINSEIGSDCSDEMFFIFPETKDHPRQTVKCRTVIEVSDISRGLRTPDWAILETESIPRPAFEVSQAGIAENESFKMHVIDPKENGPTRIGGKLLTKTCKEDKEFVAVPEGRQKAVESADGCSARPGNSGGPIVNIATGKVTAILHAGYFTQFYGVIISTSDQILYSNLACITSEALGFGPSDSCVR